MHSAIAGARWSCCAFVFWGWAALANLDCCSFSFLVLVFVGALQFYTYSKSTCDPVAETLNAIPGVSWVDCRVRALSVVLLLRILWPLLFDAAVRPRRWWGLGVGSVLLTRCDADAASGVRVFVCTIAWPLASTVLQH